MTNEPGVVEVSSGPGPMELSDAQRAGLDVRQADQDRTLAAMHCLEAMLGAAAPGRQDAWRAEVAAAVKVLDEAIAEEADNAEAPDSLLSDIAGTQPRLRNRVRGLRLQYRQMQTGLGSLRRELDQPGEPPVDFADLRQRLAWVLAGLRHQRDRESDLIYEAYYEAFRADLAADADHRRGSPGEHRSCSQPGGVPSRARFPDGPDRRHTDAGGRVPVADRPLIVETFVADGTATVAVHGEVDLASVDDLRAALTSAIATRPSRLVVDLAATTFIDCSATRMIAQACRKAPGDCQIVLRSPTRLVRKVIELAGMDRMCQID